VLRFALPESPRYLATHGRGDEALGVLTRLGIAGPKEKLTTDAASNTKSDPFAVVFSQFPVRVIAGMICFTAFFGVAIGLGAWLPNIMNAKGFSITKSLQYTLAMNFAVPCASLFMMYALDKFGRKITSVCAFICAGIMAMVFSNAETAGHGCRLHHDLLRPGRGQFDADLRVRSFPDQRADVGIWLGCGRWPVGDGLHHADDSVGAERLWLDDGVRLPRDPACGRRGGGHSVGSGIASEGSRRNRRADGLIGVRQSCGARFGAMPGRASPIKTGNLIVSFA
jgi:hypothetical protein